jgi:uroporphyrinogen III methyltransferase/synthase
MAEKGKVYLLGAGPGDAGLLTVKADRLLREAQVVVYDRLVGRAVLEMLPKEAELIDVGKNAGNHPVAQDEINRLLLRKALEGKRVVRLKGGDGFLFGRGGEELTLLYENGVDFEVVPGVTSAFAAPAYAGIPVTHRDFCSSVHIITGHKRENGALSIDYDALTRLDGTLIFMMSVSSVKEIMEGLLKSGMEGGMPCAAIENGACPNQRKFVGTVSTICELMEQNRVESPAVIVVGRVCALSERFDWFSKLPLFGKKILVTRPKATAGRLLTLLRELGADAMALPSIKTEPLDFQWPDLERYSLLVFTSAAGVDAFIERLFGAKRDARVLFGKKIAAIGSETAKELLHYGLSADFVPSAFSGGRLAREMVEAGFVSTADRALLLRAKEGSRELNDVLLEHRIPFDEIAVYRTEAIKNEGIDPASFDCVTFTSASCVTGFVRSVGEGADFSRVRAVCIGEQTAHEAGKYGMQIQISKEATISSMVELLCGGVL